MDTSYVAGIPATRCEAVGRGAEVAVGRSTGGMEAGSTESSRVSPQRSKSTQEELQIRTQAGNNSTYSVPLVVR